MGTLRRNFLDEIGVLSRHVPSPPSPRIAFSLGINEERRSPAREPLLVDATYLLRFAAPLTDCTAIRCSGLLLQPYRRAPAAARPLRPHTCTLLPPSQSSVSVSALCQLRALFARAARGLGEAFLATPADRAPLSVGSLRHPNITTIMGAGKTTPHPPPHPPPPPPPQHSWQCSCTFCLTCLLLRTLVP